MSPVTFLVWTLTVLHSTSAYKIVCYYSSWAVYYGGGFAVQPEDLDPNMCSYINYAFAAINLDGSLSPQDEWADVKQDGYKRVTALKEKNPKLKVMLSIGGPNASSQIFSSVAADPEKRSAMVASSRSFLEIFGFDGIDIHWKFPDKNDKKNLVALLKDYYEDDYVKNGWEVSLAVSADVGDGYDVPRMAQYLNHINVMTYDMYGPESNYTGQNSPLYPSSVENDWEKANLNMEAAINQWIQAGASSHKLIAGIAFYGYSFTLADPNNNGLHAPITGPGHGGPVTGEGGSWSYFEFLYKKDFWTCKWDAEQKMLICLDGDQWLGTDDEGSIRNKVAYIKRNGLGGAMIWSIDQDDVHGFFGNARPLLHAIKDHLHAVKKNL